jgi:hypothetical protein
LKLFGGPFGEALNEQDRSGFVSFQMLPCHENLLRYVWGKEKEVLLFGSVAYVEVRSFLKWMGFL